MTETFLNEYEEDTAQDFDQKIGDKFSGLS